MGQELFFGIGTVVLLCALVYGVMQYRRRNTAAVREGDKVVADRYRHDRT
ncbi:MAG: hypothetical protein NT113_06225 [Hyphomicrobiales bacterium]|jgi:hypothetical protein|nr:hypothetical protein [Hyphomicrobiales bacterium]